MKTLYDIVGALPDDDAEDLRVAFRKAVKANHPDLNPGSPEAAHTFRRIVRANAILSDQRQREAYDRLLEAARRQQQKPNRSAFSAAIRRLGVDAMASAVAAAVFIGGYLLLNPVGRLPLASAEVTEISRREPVQTVAGRSTELSSQERTLKPQDLKETTRLASVSPSVTTGIAPAARDVVPTTEPRRKDVKYYRERGSSAYRSGDLYIALANFDLAIQQDPACSDCYVDRGIVLHRMGDQKGAFSDVAEAKRIDALSRSKPVSDASAR
ncbi:J domain-containing protein [Bradyrhizobium paxllaeri]|uniref:J domain-containing protein n=1 Tax=Bradyrhizobium paxllaeri TaxID=190148 RepID=UPI0008105EB2|nr:J domain-containing protein [Bradyrhizobium paxllaeri]